MMANNMCESVVVHQGEPSVDGIPTLPKKEKVPHGLWSRLVAIGVLGLGAFVFLRNHDLVVMSARLRESDQPAKGKLLRDVPFIITMPDGETEDKMPVLGRIFKWVPEGTASSVNVEVLGDEYLHRVGEWDGQNCQKVTRNGVPRIECNKDESKDEVYKLMDLNTAIEWWGTSVRAVFKEE